MSNLGPIQKPITATKINNSFNKGFTLSSYEGLRVFDSEIDAFTNIPERPQPISYSDFLNKITIGVNLTAPEIIFTRQPADKNVAINSGDVSFAVDATVNFNTDTWPNGSPTVTARVVIYTWEESTDGGASWNDVGGNSKSYTTSSAESNDGNLYRVRVTAIVRSVDSAGNTFDITSTTEYSRTATLRVSEVVYDNPVVTFIRTLPNLTLTIIRDTNGNLLQLATGVMAFNRFNLTIGGWTVSWPSNIPPSRQGDRDTRFLWEYRASPFSAVRNLIDNPLAGVSFVPGGDEYLQFTNLNNNSLDGYQFRVRIRAIQDLVNPADELIGIEYSNWATLRVNEEIEGLASLTSITSNSDVVDTLDTIAAGPTFTLRTNRAIGKEVKLTSTTNTKQFGPDFGPTIGQGLVREKTITITDDVMTVGLAKDNAPQPAGLLFQDGRHNPETDTLTVEPIGNDWQQTTVSTNYRILNDTPRAALKLRSNRQIEGTNFYGEVHAADLPNTDVIQWEWVLNGFSIGSNPLVNDFPQQNGSFGFGATPTLGTVLSKSAYYANFNIPTFKDPTNPSSGETEVKKTGTLEIYNQNGTLFARRTITILQYKSEPAVTLPSIINSYSDAASRSNVISTKFFSDGSGTSFARNRQNLNVKNFTWAQIPSAEIGDWLISFGSSNITVNDVGGGNTTVADIGAVVRKGTDPNGVPYVLLTTDLDITFSGIPLPPSDIEVRATTTVTVKYKFDQSIRDTFTLTQTLGMIRRLPDGTPL